LPDYCLKLRGSASDIWLLACPVPTYRRRDKDLVKTHGPQIKVAPKFVKKYGLSNETSLENIDRDLFVSRFYTKAVQKAEKY
jgi:hypothetical protein